MNTQSNSSMWQRNFPQFYARVSRWTQFHKEQAAQQTVEKYLEAGLGFASAQADVAEALRNWGFWERQYCQLGFRLLSFQDFDRIRMHAQSTPGAAAALQNALLRQKRFASEKVVFHSLPFFRTYMRSTTRRISRR